ncbi:hypothetical protein [Paracoccus kondratievae]|uniref:hypothetical protein n=1 Tax=Paracoccus kondratievae TaxID=135740 RepID=UPI00155DB3C7|nr:hypothetical protein [Paracoccus kondratievae]
MVHPFGTKTTVSGQMLLSGGKRLWHVRLMSGGKRLWHVRLNPSWNRNSPMLRDVPMSAMSEEEREGQLFGIRGLQALFHHLDYVA